ncbi:MAG: DUF4249 family protein [Bacteroidota bacterium]
MKKYIFLTILLSLIIGIFSCVDEIKLNIDTEQRSFVVDGFVTDSLGDFQLKLSESAIIGVGRDNILDPITGATVQLLDTDGGVYPYVESAENLGTYELFDFKALRGKSYFIDIVLADGRHYQSTPAELRSKSTIGAISYDVREERFRNNTGTLVTQNILSANISTDFSEAEVPPFLQWRVSGIYQFQEDFPDAISPKRCFIDVNLDLNDIRILDASQVNEGALFEQTIAELEYDFRFADQFCLHVSQFSITEEEFNYWRSIKEIIDIDGSLFDPPPGTVVGNIRNVDNPEDVAVGYFSVASVFFKRYFVDREVTGVFVRGQCEGFFLRTPFACDDCLLIGNSTTVQPDYWEF